MRTTHGLQARDMKKKKINILDKFSRNLRAFYPELDNHFMCPICLEIIPLTEQSKISEAHIVPRSAGGGLKTYLCTKCNSEFGSQQDKWMGEYVRLRRRRQSLLHTSLKRDYFKIGGVRVGGTFEVSPTGGLNFLIRTDMTSPKSLELLQSKVAEYRRSGRSTISVPIPLLENRDLVNIGFLTLAYLMWFKELGYSWALQNHLQPIRDQIQNPSKKIILEAFLAVCEDQIFERPWIGVGHVRGELTLLTGMSDRIVFLPPADREYFYSQLGSGFDNLRLSDYRILQFSVRHYYNMPVGVMFGDRVIVAPDPILKGTVPGNFILFLPGEGSPRLLRPVSEKECEQLRQLPNAVAIRPRYQLQVPEKETGRLNNS